MRRPAPDLLKLGPTAAFLATGSLVAWAGLMTTLFDGDYQRTLAQAEYWAQAGFMAFGALLLTAIAGLVVWVLLDDPSRRTDA